MSSDHVTNPALYRKRSFSVFSIRERRAEHAIHAVRQYVAATRHLKKKKRKGSHDCVTVYWCMWVYSHTVESADIYISTCGAHALPEYTNKYIINQLNYAISLAKDSLMVSIR